MNDMIKKLAEQARREFLKLPTGYKPDQVGMYPQLMEKFAKLIIDECCDRMEYIDERVVPRPTWQLYEHFHLDWKKDWYSDSYGVWRKNDL
jgi:hypothetical protein